ncbi:hypothetical protein D3C75_265540 [compost metagenome]
MKKLLFSSLLAILLFGLLFSSRYLVDDTAKTPKSSNDFIIGAHYFGDEWPVNFWSSEIYNVQKDLQNIKNDGFNSIVLVIPWGEFQPSISPIRYNEQLFDRLKYIIEEASKTNLKVILRLGYVWDFDPTVQYPSSERFKKLPYDQEFYNAWLEYIGEIQHQVASYNNVSFAFLTWEDLWGMVDEARTLKTVSERIHYADVTGYQRFLKENYKLSEVSQLYGQSFASYEDIPTPTSDNPGIKWLYEYCDDLLINRYFVPAKEKFPNLSLEVRVDSDLVHTNNGNEWFSHQSTYDLPNSEYTTMYYSPAMGAENRGNFDSATKVIARFENIVGNVRNNSNNKIFIDQFLYYDNTPAFGHNTLIEPSQEKEFLKKSYDVLSNYTNGYALWNYRDYAANMLYNPAFEFDFKGWETFGNLSIVKNNGDKSAEIQQGGILKNIIPKSKDSYQAFFENVRLSFNSRSLIDGTVVKIRLGNWQETKVIDQKWRSYTFDIPLKNLESYNLSFQVQKGSLIVDDVKIYSFVQRGKVYDEYGNGEELLSSIRELNSRLNARISTSP